MNAVPNLQDELDRKTLETVSWLVSSFAIGNISVSQFSTGLDAVFMATGGLVNDGLFRTITEVSEEIPDSLINKEEAHFIKDGNVISLTWSYGDDFYTMRAIRGNNESKKNVQADTPKDAAIGMQKAVTNLINGGYRKL